ncbi:efflux RND transporter periplasmic adaptor subunit [Silvibacterium dinghuense]|uniref:HlyD family efflux transporter periplasmic adaptor subunit n=1 Tax=Silvibacterium dinghuense TaxID=1560006 RepID=A0A4Q1S8I7_9BACT|nr:efflux RND transporter periplasmic adaptor subunit [Silvibacterium dinghuense]RXS93292.1 HlyD family efflux transporter periplasmic adaptor subunit [Silvibacterium dinghuense]GGH04609.1 RND transporter [Silvibacterium dinghuense]
MKKIILSVLAVVVVAGIVVLTIVRAQSGYTKVYTGKVVRQDLVSTVSGTGQIKPKTYVNLGATAFGRITHLYVKEGDKVHKGEVVASIENVQQGANVEGQRAAIAAAQTDIASYIAAEKTQQANIEHAKADLEQKKLDFERAQALYKDGIMAKQDFDAKKAAYDLDIATLAQSDAALAQAKAQTDSARGHLTTQEATLRANVDLLGKTVASAPFDGIVTNLPVREGETVVEGIQNAEGSTLMTLADMSVITAEVKVDETDIVNVALGQEADVTVDALPGKVFKGHVTLVGDQALLRSTGQATSTSTSGQEEAKDFKVVVTLDVPSDELRPGLSTTAKIVTAHKQNVLTIPIQALALRAPSTGKTGTGATVQAASADGAAQKQQQGVFVVRNDGGKLRVHFVPVSTGITGTTDIEVLSGLQTGDEIVTGSFSVLRDLKDDALIKRDTTPQTTTTSSSGSGS